MFDDERSEWVDVPDSMDALTAFKKCKEENPFKTCPEIIQDLSEWVEPDFIDDY